MEIIIITGLSGAGKSQAARCIEDWGYYCIDNMPPKLVMDFINLSLNGSEDLKRVAFVLDIRVGEFFSTLKDSLDEVRAIYKNLKILFFEASDDVLVRRYKESRRDHPLSKEGDIARGILKERDKLSEIRALSDYIIDTSNMKTSQLRVMLTEIVKSDSDVVIEELTIVLRSFGYKSGIPAEADYVFDVRFIPNPFYLASMKRLTGNSKKVKDYVLKWPETQEFVQKTYELIDFLIPYHAKEGKTNIVIAIGCTGGQHRSVTIANRLHEMFLASGRRVFLSHREL